MSYYDHATAMVFKLDRWSDEKPLRHYELEALKCDRQRLNTSDIEQASLLSFKTVLLKKMSVVTKHFGIKH